MTITTELVNQASVAELDNKRCQEPLSWFLRSPVNTVCRWNDLSGLQDIFETAGDFEAFEQVLIAAQERLTMRMLAY